MKKYMVVIILILLFGLIGRIYVNALFYESIAPVVIEDVSVCTELEEERCLEKLNNISQDTQDIYLDVKYSDEELAHVTWYYTLSDNTVVIAEDEATEFENQHTFSLKKDLSKGWLLGKYGVVVQLRSGNAQNYFFEVR